MATTLETLNHFSDLLDRASRCVTDDNRSPFELHMSLALKEFIEQAAKCTRVFSNLGWSELKRDFDELRWSTEEYRRCIDLANPDSEDTLIAGLLWAAEQGSAEHLAKLRRLKESDAHLSAELHALIDVAATRIEQRVNDFAYVLRRGEEAYQANREAWDKTYAGNYIAIHDGKIVAHDQDRLGLVEQLGKIQGEGCRFRAYIVKVGEPVNKVRGPHARRRMRGRQ